MLCFNHTKNSSVLSFVHHFIFLQFGGIAYNIVSAYFRYINGGLINYMVKSHKIYNLIFDFLLAAGVCFYNDLRFMRFWFLGGQLYHSVGFTNYRFGLTGKEVCWDFSPLNILHCLQGYDPHAYLKFLCFFCIGILMFFRFVFRAPKLLPRLFARLFCFSAGYIAVVELYNLLFTAAGAVFLDISNWFLYLTGAWSAIAILTLLLVASKKFRPAPLPSTPSL